MAAESNESKGLSSTTAQAEVMTSCRKKKSESATFLEDVKDHIDEFIHASMDEHKTCFEKTIKKMFSMSKVVADRNSGTTEVETATEDVTLRVRQQSSTSLIANPVVGKRIMRIMNRD